MTTVPGHECNAYCKPDEGVHCLVDHVFDVWQKDDWGLTEYETASPWREVGFFADGETYPVVRTEHAHEIPPPTLEEANAIRKQTGMGQVYESDRYVGAALVWFRVPVEAPA